MAHHFLKAPNSYSVDEAIRWAQVHAFVGDKRSADGLRGTKLICDYGDNDFHSGVIQFFIDNPMLDTALYGPIIDYIWNQKYENRIAFIEDGVAENVGPAQPNFSLKQRTVESLLRNVERWHTDLGHEAKAGSLHWKKSEVADFNFVEGEAKSKNMKVRKIKELLNSSQLVAEGRAMKHCVATYAHSCHKRMSSIWTMAQESKDGIVKLTTIEVNVKLKRIVQIRGKANRLPTTEEKKIISRWADQSGLTLAEHL